MQPEIQHLNLEGGGKLIQPALEEMLLHALVSLEAKADQSAGLPVCSLRKWHKLMASAELQEPRVPEAGAPVQPGPSHSLCCCSSAESSPFSRTPSKSQAQSSGTDN